MEWIVTASDSEQHDIEVEGFEPQYVLLRPRIKGFAGLCSWEPEEDDLIEIPDECPNICTGGVGLIMTDE